VVQNSWGRSNRTFYKHHTGGRTFTDIQNLRKNSVLFWQVKKQDDENREETNLLWAKKNI
jgi:hypothetical protein